MKLKGTYSLEEKLWQTRTAYKKQRHYFANKGPSSQSYGFSSSHVWMWELDHKESWLLKNWCFPTGVLVKILESSFNCKDIKLVDPKGNQAWIFIWRTDAEAEAPVLWPPDAKSQLTGKVPDAGKYLRQKQKGMAEDKMVRLLVMFITDSMNMNLSKLWEIIGDRGTWWAIVHGIVQLSNWTTSALKKNSTIVDLILLS